MRVEERPQGFRLTFPRDSLGHGDLGTAFLLALLAASELSGKKIVRAGAIAHPKGYERFARERERREREMERLRQGGPEDDPFVKLAQLSGRGGFRVPQPGIIELE